jgi:hypothetical protein
MKIKKIQKVLIFLVSGAIFIFLTYRFLSLGLQAKLKKINLQIKVEEEKLRQGLRIQKDKDKVLEEYKNYSSYFKVGSHDREIVAKFLKEIENITQESGVLVVNLTPENQPEQIQGYKKFRADLKAEANIEQLYNFLYQIKDSKLLVKLDKISIAPKNEEASVLRIETTISIAAP